MMQKNMDGDLEDVGLWRKDKAKSLHILEGSQQEFLVGRWRPGAEGREGTLLFYGFVIWQRGTWREQVLDLD